jgi:hypothetical protein
MLVPRRGRGRRVRRYIQSVRRNAKNHIVTAGYLRRFADRNGLIQPVTRTVSPAGIIKPRRPETVGYRSRFFVDRQIADPAEHRRRWSRSSAK